jgi:D-threo-aldose 1-dehydrogenase
MGRWTGEDVSNRVGPTRLAFGTAPLATGWWGNVEERALDSVVAALDAGIRWFDTAPLYGSGEAEVRLGAGLAERRSLRADVTVATKVGRTLDPGAPGGVRFDFTPAELRRQLESSLERLGLDRVDVVHLHDPEDHMDEALGTALDALCELRDEGLTAALSVGTNVAATAAAFAAHDGVDLVMLAGRITLLDHRGVDIALPAATAAGVPLLAAAPFNSGLLARPVEGSWFDYQPAHGELAHKAAALADACERAGIDLRTAALQYPFRHPGVAAVVAGMASREEVAANIDAMSAPVPTTLWSVLDDIAAA